MTLFAVICAGIFPGIHVGRIWMAWFMAPVPNPNWIWPNFRSPLMWDVFAVSTYFTVSVLFWYLGLVPDLATHAGSGKGPDGQKCVLVALFRVAGRQPAMASLRNGLFNSGRYFHAAGSVGALNGVIRLRHLSAARLAYHDFSALFCRRGNFWRICHGVDLDAPGAIAL